MGLADNPRYRRSSQTFIADNTHFGTSKRTALGADNTKGKSAWFLSRPYQRHWRRMNNGCLGARLPVAPVFSESRAPVARNFYPPAGEWFDFWTGERIARGAYITRVCELDTIPLYVRAGTILPLGPEHPFIGDEILD